MVEIQFQQLSSKHDEQQSKQAARALWGGVHGVCILSLTGKLDLVGVGNIEETVVLLGSKSEFFVIFLVRFLDRSTPLTWLLSAAIISMIHPKEFNCHI